MTRIIVCGGRDYADRQHVIRSLDRIHAKRPVTCVIQGGASGADLMAKAWAMDRGIKTVEFPAEWEVHGRSAGPVRNRKMLSDGKPDGVVAFPGNRGTDDMVSAAKAAGVPVWKP